MRAVPRGSEEGINEPSRRAGRAARGAQGFHDGGWCDGAGGDDRDDATEMPERHLWAATTGEVVGERLEPRRRVPAEPVETPRQPGRHPGGVPLIAGVAQPPRHDHPRLAAGPARPRRRLGSMACASPAEVTQPAAAPVRPARVTAPWAGMTAGTVADTAVAASAAARSERTEGAALTAGAGHVHQNGGNSNKARPLRPAPQPRQAQDRRK